MRSTRLRHGLCLSRSADWCYSARWCSTQLPSLCRRRRGGVYGYPVQARCLTRRAGAGSERGAQRWYHGAGRAGRLIRGQEHGRVRNLAGLACARVRPVAGPHAQTGLGAPRLAAVQIRGKEHESLCWRDTVPQRRDGGGPSEAQSREVVREGRARRVRGSVVLLRLQRPSLRDMQSHQRPLRRCETTSEAYGAYRRLAAIDGDKDCSEQATESWRSKSCDGHGKVMRKSAEEPCAIKRLGAMWAPAEQLAWGQCGRQRTREKGAETFLMREQRTQDLRGDARETADEMKRETADEIERETEDEIERETADEMKRQELPFSLFFRPRSAVRLCDRRGAPFLATDRAGNYNEGNGIVF